MLIFKQSSQFKLITHSKSNMVNNHIPLSGTVNCDSLQFAATVISHLWSNWIEKRAHRHGFIVSYKHEEITIKSGRRLWICLLPFVCLYVISNILDTVGTILMNLGWIMHLAIEIRHLQNDIDWPKGGVTLNNWNFEITTIWKRGML